jgi:hypothetical protein
MSIEKAQLYEELRTLDRELALWRACLVEHISTKLESSSRCFQESQRVKIGLYDRVNSLQTAIRSLCDAKKPPRLFSIIKEIRLPPLHQGTMETAYGVIIAVKDAVMFHAIMRLLHPELYPGLV